MNTAEKRADLEAAGEPWPDCTCHGEPLLWQRNPRMVDGGRFYCRVASQTGRNKWRQRRQDAQLCVDCGNTADSGLRCRSCADRHADHMAAPKQRMLHQLANARWRNSQRASKGFRSTGVGLPLFAAWTKGPDDED